MQLKALKVKPRISNDPLLDIMQRIYCKNMNWLGIICGATGSGKSFSAIDLCYMIDPSFDEYNIVFETHDFAKLLNDPKIHKGSAVLYDEFGKGASSREWYTEENKQLGKILQTFRRMNVAVAFTVPTWDFVDKIPRKLVHTYIETFGINQHDRQSTVKWYNLQINPRFAKTYNRFPQILQSKIRYVKLRKAPHQILRGYEQRKKIYEEGVRRVAQEKTMQGDPFSYNNPNDERLKMKRTTKKHVIGIAKKVLEQTVTLDDIPDALDVYDNYDITQQQATQIVAYVRKKLLKKNPDQIKKKVTKINNKIIYA